MWRRPCWRLPSFFPSADRRFIALQQCASDGGRTATVRVACPAFLARDRQRIDFNQFLDLVETGTTPAITDSRRSQGRLDTRRGHAHRTKDNGVHLPLAHAQGGGCAPCCFRVHLKESIMKHKALGLSATAHGEFSRRDFMRSAAALGGAAMMGGLWSGTARAAGGGRRRAPGSRGGRRTSPADSRAE